jgi:hypothetical protein
MPRKLADWSKPGMVRWARSTLAITSKTTRRHAGPLHVATLSLLQYGWIRIVSNAHTAVRVRTPTVRRLP